METKVANVPTNVDVAVKLVRRIGLLAALAGSLSACAGFGIKAEGYRIDEIQHTARTYKQPLKCLFTSCETLEVDSAGGK